MKKKIFLLVTIMMLCLPLVTKAKTYYDGYSTMNFEETLKAEGMEIQNKNYKETKDQAIVYMFRGQGCGFCQRFLTFMNSISKDYGKYFKMVSFEVWNDAKNSELFGKMSNVTGVAAEGVPYVIIGEKVFDGYASSYDDQIKEAIMNEYNNKGKDVFEKLQEYDNGTYVPEENANNGASGNNYGSTSSSSGSDTFAIVFWNFIFILAGTCTIVYFQIKHKNEIIESLKKEEKKDTKETKKKKLGE